MIKHTANVLTFCFFVLAFAFISMLAFSSVAWDGGVINDDWHITLTVAGSLGTVASAFCFARMLKLNVFDDRR